MLGRDSVTINSGGEKIFAEEVEKALSAHPAVYDVVVVGRPHPRWGEEIVAIVSLRRGSTTTDTELQDTASALLARYKVPKQVLFVEEVRRNVIGKMDYTWARERAEAAVV